MSGALARLQAEAGGRILVLDGSWGVMIQRQGLDEAAFRGARFADHPRSLKGDNDLLCLTRPEFVTELHDAYFAAGADIAETNTFNATAISQADYGLESAVREINLAAARLARESADRWSARTPDRPRFVAGAIGPTNRTLSMSADVDDPGARAVSFDQLRASYAEQAAALIEGGVDFLLIETIFDTLNAKAAIKAIFDLADEGVAGRRSGFPARSPTALGAPSLARPWRRSGTRSATRGRSPSGSTAPWAPS